MADDTATCSRCGFRTTVDAPDFFEWEAIDDGAPVCPGCVTAQEQQTLDEADMALGDELHEGRPWLIDATAIRCGPQLGALTGP